MKILEIIHNYRQLDKDINTRLQKFLHKWLKASGKDFDFANVVSYSPIAVASGNTIKDENVKIWYTTDYLDETEVIECPASLIDYGDQKMISDYVTELFKHQLETKKRKEAEVEAKIREEELKTLAYLMEKYKGAANV